MIRPHLIDSGKLQTGDVIVQHTDSRRYKPSTWSSYIIRRMTSSYRNHSGEIIIIKWEIYVIESLWWGITMTRWSEFRNPDKYVKHLRMIWFSDKFSEKDYIIKALQQLDKRYDYLWIFKLFLLICFGYWSSPSKNISETHWRCSEYNAWMKDLSWWQSWLPKDFVSHKDFVVVN